jgi:hypothetical protein
LILANATLSPIISLLPVDLNSLPHDPAILKQMLVDLTAQLDKTQRLLRQLVAAKGGTRSEQLSEDQLRLFGQEAGVEQPAEEPKGDDDDPPPASGASNREDNNEGRQRGRRPLPSHLKRERIEHDLREEEKHCAACSQDLRLIGEDSSERYEWLRSSHSFAAIYSSAVAGDRRHLQEVRVRVHCEDGDEAAATDRKEYGGRIVTSARDREQDRGSLARASPGENSGAAWGADTGPDHVRLDAASGGTADATVWDVKTFRFEFQSNRHR